MVLLEENKEINIVPLVGCCLVKGGSPLKKYDMTGPDSEEYSQAKDGIAAWS